MNTYRKTAITVGALFIVCTVASFTSDFGLESAHTYLHIPIGVQELVFAVWLIVKGFNPTAVTSLSAKADEKVYGSSLRGARIA